MMELALFTGQMETLLIKLFLKKEVVVGRYFFTTQTGTFKQFSEDGTIVFLSRYENGEEVHNESNSNLNYLLTQSKKLAHIVYRKCAFLIKLLDQIVEAIMVRTIYRLSDRQKNVIMNILILVGVGVVNELTR